jgi:hypothetical protein
MYIVLLNVYLRFYFQHEQSAQLNPRQTPHRPRLLCLCHWHRRRHRLHRHRHSPHARVPAFQTAEVGVAARVAATIVIVRMRTANLAVVNMTRQNKLAPSLIPFRMRPRPHHSVTRLHCPSHRGLAAAAAALVLNCWRAPSMALMAYLGAKRRPQNSRMPRHRGHVPLLQICRICTHLWKRLGRAR